MPGWSETVSVPTTNMDMIVSTVEEAAEQALSELDGTNRLIDLDGPILLAPQAKHDANWLVNHVLLQRLLERGYQVILDSSAVSNGSARLSYRILDLGIRGQSGLLTDQVKRQSHITLAIRLSDAVDETIHWQQEKTVVKENTAPKKTLETLQSTSHGFAETELEEETWGKFVEPVIVSTVLGGLMYFFFSNR